MAIRADGLSIKTFFPSLAVLHLWKADRSVGECDTHCLARGSWGSFYKHPLQKEKSAYSSIIEQPVNPQAMEKGGRKIEAAGVLGLRLRILLVNNTLTILKLCWLHPVMSVCERFGSIPVVVQMVWKSAFSRIMYKMALLRTSVAFLFR